MYTPSGFEKVRREDYAITPFTANKRYSIPSSQALELGYTVRTANYFNKKFPVSSSKASYRNAPTSSDGTINYLNWFSLDYLYYRYPYDRGRTLEGFRQTKIEKQLFLTASLISAPYNDMGQGFKEGTIFLTSSNLDLRDDSYGNLYDNTISSATFADSTYLDAYWSFDDLYHTTNKGFTDTLYLNKAAISNTTDSIQESTYYKVRTEPGVQVNATGSGTGIGFYLDSYVATPHNDQLVYETGEDFTISFWVRVPPSQSNFDSDQNYIISKRSLRNIDRFGEFQTQTDNGIEVRRVYQRTEEEPETIDYYPYEFSVYNSSSLYNGEIKFSRSDGVQILTLSSSVAINDGTYHHISTVKSGSLISLYVDGVLQSSGQDVKQQPINTHTLMFGALDKSGTSQFSGSLDEVRFYSKGSSQAQISGSLADNIHGRLYQTNKVGNVFYRRGEVVLTSRIPKYHRYFNTDNWSLRYRNKYTIYEYETIVRVKAGTFNRSMNPSSKKSRKSDEYLNEFSGSLNPYITSIGLYNSNYELVAVGKLGRPLKTREDVDVNFIVRWDY
jgi:hypothetical protein